MCWQIAFAGNYFYDVGLYFPKLSIITIYHKLFPPSTISLQMRIWLYALSLYTVAACITTFCVDTFWCAPNIASNWSMDEGACSSFNSNTLFQLNWALNVSSDILSEEYFLLLLRLLPVANILSLSESIFVSLSATCKVADRSTKTRRSDFHVRSRCYHYCRQHH